MLSDKLEYSDIDDLSDEEVAFWFNVVKEQEQIKQMKKALKDYLDVRDTKESPRTIKIDSKVINP